MRSKENIPSNIKRIACLFVLILSAIGLSGCTHEKNSTDSENSTRFSSIERVVKPAYKGMELYSWQADTGEWVYAIQNGTNRIKSTYEIKLNPMDFDEVKIEMSKMAIGEMVFWLNDSKHTSAGQEIFLAMPPGEIIEMLKLHAREVQINLIMHDP